MVGGALLFLVLGYFENFREKAFHFICRFMGLWCGARGRLWQWASAFQEVVHDDQAMISCELGRHCPNTPYAVFVLSGYDEPV